MTKKQKLKKGKSVAKKDAPSGPSPTLEVPSNKWDAVEADKIGAGFEVVDLDEFDDREPANEKPSKRIELRFRKFKNKFVFGRSSFITYDAKKLVIKVKDNSKRKEPINLASRVTKSQRRSFGKSLDTNIRGWVDMFMTEVLPITLSVHTASEEVRERMTQLVDANVKIPEDYVQAQLSKAVQMRITREVSKIMKLSEEEKRLMFADFLPKAPVK